MGTWWIEPWLEIEDLSDGLGSVTGVCEYDSSLMALLLVTDEAEGEWLLLWKPDSGRKGGVGGPFGVETES